MGKIIVIVGPTGVGKTKLSIELAKKLNGEIINADSTQVYKELNIATAKVTKEETENIKHHLINIKNITEEYTVYHYQQECRKAIAKIINDKKTPILVGGTGLYIKAALYDYKFIDNIKRNDYNQYNNEELYQMLLQKDPNTNLHKNNRRRIERRLDYLKSGSTIPNNSGNKLLYDAIFIGLTTNREILYNKINNRVDEMISIGLLDEAKQIYNSQIRTKAVMTPIGYKELFEYFSNKKSLEESVELIKQRSRNYAKRQYTWFNNQMPVTWFDVNYNNFNETIKEVINFIKKQEQ